MGTNNRKMIQTLSKKKQSPDILSPPKIEKLTKIINDMSSKPSTYPTKINSRNESSLS